MFLAHLICIASELRFLLRFGFEVTFRGDAGVLLSIISFSLLYAWAYLAD
jgi:hypothetical protein